MYITVAILILNFGQSRVKSLRVNAAWLDRSWSSNTKIYFFDYVIEWKKKKQTRTKHTETKFKEQENGLHVSFFCLFVLIRVAGILLILHFSGSSLELFHENPKFKFCRTQYSIPSGLATHFYWLYIRGSQTLWASCGETVGFFICYPSAWVD